jgi:hypothetical protein
MREWLAKESNSILHTIIQVVTEAEMTAVSRMIVGHCDHKMDRLLYSGHQKTPKHMDSST